MEEAWSSFLNLRERISSERFLHKENDMRHSTFSKTISFFSFILHGHFLEKVFHVQTMGFKNNF